MKANLKHISHELIPLFIDENSNVLLLGSFPSVKTRLDGFYYAHPRNRFYLVLANIFNEDCPLSIYDRKTFLKKHHIALYDVIYECDISSSNDSSISNAKVIDLEIILSDYPNIKLIAINGTKAKQLFDKYLHKIAKKHNKKVIYLPSTSPANAKMDVVKLTESYKKIIDELKIAID